MLASLLAHPLCTGLTCAAGLVLGAAETTSGGGGANLLGWAAIIASLTGLVGTVYTIVRGEREDRRRDREGRRHRG